MLGVLGADTQPSTAQVVAEGRFMTYMILIETGPGLQRLPVVRWRVWLKHVLSRQSAPRAAQQKR